MKQSFFNYTFIRNFYNEIPLFTIMPNSSNKKFTLVFDFFSPPSPSITKICPPEFKNALIEFISNSVNLFRGPGNTNILPVDNNSSVKISLFLKYDERYKKIYFEFNKNI